MKIYIIGTLSGLNQPVKGGPERALKNTITGVMKYDQENMYIIIPLGFRESVPPLLSSNIRLYPIDCDLVKPFGHASWIQAKKHVTSVIKKEQPDVVLCHDPLFMTLVPHNIRKHTIIILHGPFWKGHLLLYPSLRTMHKLLYRYFVLSVLSMLNLETSPLILCVANSLRDELPKKLQARSLVLENPVNEELFYLPRKTIPVNKKREVYIISVGSLKPWKNYETLVLAVKEILDKNKSLKNKVKVKIICGYVDSFNSYYHKLITLIKKCELNNVVSIITNLGDDALKEEYRSADIYIHTGLIEGLPNAVQEAMATGLPIIATRSGEIPSVINHEYNGLLFSGYDYKKLASCINLLLLNPHLARKLGQNAKATAYSRWSLQSYITKLNLILKRFTKQEI